MRKLSTKDSPSCGSCSYNPTVYVTLESGLDCVHNNNDVNWKCGALNELKGDDDESFDDDLRLLNGLSCDSNIGGGKVYTVIVVRRDGEEEVRAVVGKYRHAWIAGNVVEEEAVKMVAEIFMKVFVNGGREDGWIDWWGVYACGGRWKACAFVQLTECQSADWNYDWEFQDSDDNILAPIVETLKPLADVRVESQVLYYTPKSSFSYWDDKLGSYIFSTKDLPFFVNSNEWHLDTSVAAGGRSKILQFVVYVSPAKECPLVLQLPNGEVSTTNGFISPMWGGVVVWNPLNCSADSAMVPRRNISPEALRNIFEVFIGQLRQLFGLKSSSLLGDASGKVQFLTSERGFSEWELDALSRQHTCFNLVQCGTTLGSLSQLVQSLPRMIIKDEIGKQVTYSLEAAKLGLSNTYSGDYDASAVNSRVARSFAEDAFYHPSMMSVSYYSFEHCFAVYSPFFLPVSLHVLLAALRELKRYKHESRKYNAWKNSI